MEIQLEDCKITSYQLGVLDNGADRTDLSIVKLLDASTPKLFSEDSDRTQLAADTGGGVYGSNDSIWMDMGFPARADAGYLNPSSFQITSAGEDEASSRLFVGNLTMNSEDSIQTGFGGGVIVASGDVNGDDDKPDLLVGCSGSEL